MVTRFSFIYCCSDSFPALKVQIHFRKFSTERKIFRGPHVQYDFFVKEIVLRMRSAENFPFRGKFSDVYLHLYMQQETRLGNEVVFYFGDQSLTFVRKAGKYFEILFQCCCFLLNIYIHAYKNKSWLRFPVCCNTHCTKVY